MDDLIAFLRARLDEDAAEIAKHPDDYETDAWDLSAETESNYPALPYLRIGKQRALADVEAKRRIVEDYRITVGAVRHVAGQNVNDPGVRAMYAGRDALKGVIRLLALPYADHPHYRQDWAPQD